MLLRISDQTRVSEREFRLANANVSFPKSLTDEALAEYGHAVLHIPSRPEAPAGQKVVDDGVEFVDSQWRVKYAAVPLSAEELAHLATNVRVQRNALLSGCDWTQLPDAAVDKQAWAAYRQALRDITQQPGFPTTVNWPEMPE